MKVKCVVWDLDNTVWNGNISENNKIALKPCVKNIMTELDKRGIIQSIASKNNTEDALNKLKEFGIYYLFVYPQINWNTKSSSLEQISKDLNFSLNTFAFIDDQEYERSEIKYTHPEILCLDGSKLDNSILEKTELNPRFITIDSARRREMYQTDVKRKIVETAYEGPRDDFLNSLGLKLKIALAIEDDLKRAEELTIRTHQLNTTGIVYNYDQLKKMIHSNNYYVIVAELSDKFGSYGKIGITVIERLSKKWSVNLFLMSCRTMSRGVGNALLTWLNNLAILNSIEMDAKFIQTNRNRIMYLTYKLAGFEEIGRDGDILILKKNDRQIKPIPNYMKIETNVEEKIKKREKFCEPKKMSVKSTLNKNSFNQRNL